MPRRQAVPHVRFIFAGYSGEYAVGCGYVLVSLRAYASACALSPFGDTVAPFLPVCAPTASASPRGHRERTLVRPLALGLASLYLHQTDKKKLLSPYRLSAIRAFGCGYVLVSLRAYASACALSPFGDTGFWLRLCARFTARIRLRILNTSKYLCLNISFPSF